MCPAPASLRLLKVKSSDLRAWFCSNAAVSNAAPASSMALQARFSSVIELLPARAAARGPVFFILMPLEAMLTRFSEGLLPMPSASALEPSSHMWFLEMSSTVSDWFTASMSPMVQAPYSRMWLSAKASIATDLFSLIAALTCSAPTSPMQLPLKSSSVRAAVAARPAARCSQPTSVIMLCARPTRLSGRPLSSAWPSSAAPPTPRWL
mmetsp:Transcript_47389/g.126831  ORF Transcript_47389/g.126831 Transcript_47389/m.126831 type:complete len:208 (+) Transcript_47389:111-734(+)